jgi:hypothetical protein
LAGFFGGGRNRGWGLARMQFGEDDVGHVRGVDGGWEDQLPVLQHGSGNGPADLGKQLRPEPQVAGAPGGGDELLHGADRNGE